jgi:hypothetical protein
MDFYWIILLIFIPILVIIPVGLIIIALYERKQKKSPKLKAKDWIAEKRLKGKGDDRPFVACSDCGKLCNPDQMSVFGYWKTTILLGDMAGIGIPAENITYEEVIPNKKPKHTYSFVKDLCPSCATRLRTIKKTFEQEIKIVGLVLLVFLLVILFKLWF